ncbi:alpha-amylase family glycosyl hydrolase [Bacteroides sp.]|uniref:alpha-amylase family glycosyl hydrolase n=1 Tax=Bacteroides sp. TaxID=29523 RepID=UPI001B3ECEF1|nr:alpha-amylase family glycosyl hydrolase [Bacteroides sp.]MBP8621140.1 alpha-amylase [Bacteroides sp.]
MQRVKNIFLMWVVVSLLFTSCSKDEPIVPIPEPKPPVTVLKDGLNYSSETPDADKELTITFKAGKSSALYSYTGDVYIYTGVIVDGSWMYVPATWEQNLPQCKMTKVEANVWSIKLSPSIRQWYGSGEAAVLKLGIVIRSADGAKKGINEDSFVTVTDSKYQAFAPAAIKQAALPSGVEAGINIIDNTTVTLVLYDKDKNGVYKDFAHVVGDFNGWKLSNDAKSQMFRDNTSGCWWITLTGLDATKEYAFQYYLGTKSGEITRLADAYCRKILDPDNDKYIPAATYSDAKEYPKGAVGIASVFKIQQDVYTWKVKDYQVKDKDNLVIYELLLRDFSATGDINGAKQKLDYLKSLGVNAIELMPIQEFDGNDSWGYNPCFFFAMDKAYGTDKMYKEFIDACHEKGIAVILDVVYNHATGSHPFAKLYWDSKSNKTAANNPWFNVDAPHPYSVFHDFNHESSMVRAFVKRNLKFLLEEYNLDGFRFDLTKGFTQKSSTESTASAYDATRIAILKDYNAAIKAVSDKAIVIMEHFCDDREDKELAADGIKVWRNKNEAYCQSGMSRPEKSDFSGLYTGTNSMTFGAYVGYMESHDEERVTYKILTYGNGDLKTNQINRLKSLSTNAAFFFTVPGPKMIWQFGEMAYDVSIDENGRTGKKPLHWEYETQNKALVDTYKKLIALRNDYPSLFTVNAQLTWKVGVSDWDNGRTLTLKSIDGKEVRVVGNFTTNPLNYTNPTGVWYNYLGDGSPVKAGESITIPAHEFRLYTSFTKDN